MKTLVLAGALIALVATPAFACRGTAEFPEAADEIMQSAHRQLTRMAGRHGRTVSQIVFRFAIDVGMVPLTGTTDAEHMREDLGVFDFRLEPKEVAVIEALMAP